MEDEQIDEVGVEGDIGVMTVVAEKVVVHVDVVASLPCFVDAMNEKEGQEGDFADGKEYQQGVNMSFRPEFRRGGKEDQRGKKKPQVTFEGAPCNGHVCRVNKSKNGYQENAE